MTTKSLVLVLSLALLMCPRAHGQRDTAGPKSIPKPDWEAKVRQAAPQTAPARPKKDRSVLVFSLSTGFQHSVLPQTETVVRILGEKSGAYRAVPSKDIEQFLARNIKLYDAVVLNNNCPTRKERDVFRDVLVNSRDVYGKKHADLPLPEREALAERLYADLVHYVADGGGLIVLHGAIANFNYSDEFSAIVGASFDRHPPAQEVILRPVEPGHPLLTPFEGKPLVHHDEPYLFNRAYPKMNFRPLLEIDTANMGHLEEIEAIREMKRYAAWIKTHEKGRVFYCSPSHSPESFENPALLQFILGGIQYALGDLDCPDTPMAAVNAGGQERFHYQAEPLSHPKGGDAFKGSNFVHPLKTPAGFVVTDCQPSDHLHHFGLWWPWKYLEIGDRRVLCWELQEGDGIIQAEGSTPTRDGLVTKSVYIDRKAPGGPATLLRETTTLTASATVDQPARGYFLDIEIIHRTAGEEPITVSPYRYSGFALRGAASWNRENSTILTSEGMERDTANFTHARWVRVQGDAGDGTSAGVLMMSRPDNHAHPEKLRTWDQQHHGAVFINFNPVADQAWTFEPGKEYARNYRVFVYDGTISRPQAETLWNAYAAAATADRAPDAP